MKKQGNKVYFKGTAAYNQSDNTFDNPVSRGSREDIITKVFNYGVRTKSNGYVNNKRIIGYEL